MKKILLLLAALVCMFCSCRKIYHATNPTPDNYRLTGYTLVTSQNIIFPPTPTPIVTENYSFIYDASNRVVQEYFTSNDSNKIRVNKADLSIAFRYVSDSIYKTSTDLKTTTVVERDTFIINSLGQITNAYFPNELHTFQYYGKLLANETVSYRDSGTVVTANLSYTSNNGDFIYRLFDGVLHVSFEDTGIRPDISPIDTTRDSVLSLPLSVSWTTFYNNGTVSTVTHTPLNTYSDILTGVDQHAVIVNAVDPNGVFVRTGYFPGGYCAQQFYQIYDYLTNRPGDYLQLQSFTTYGINIYQQVHMVKRISTPYTSTNVAYNIDADSKVATTSVVIRDSLLKNVTNQLYTLQWDTY